MVTLDGLGDRYQYVDTSEDLETEGGGEAEGEDRAREEEEQEVVEEEEEEEQEEGKPSWVLSNILLPRYVCGATGWLEKCWKDWLVLA